MDTFKYIMKFLLFISVVLAVGQISIADRTVGLRFVHGVRDSAHWAALKVSESKMFSEISLPPFIKELFPSEEQKAKDKVKKSKRVSEVEGELNTTDRQEVIQLLRN